MISLKNVSVFYLGNPILKNINMHVPKGSLSLITGVNGSGKSTLLKCISGIIRPREGCVYFDNYDISDHYDDVRKYILYVPDSIYDYEYFSVRQFLSFLGQINQLSHKDMQESISFLLDKMDIEKIIDKKISTLSKGLKQRAFLAGYLLGISKKKLAIFDEVISGLDMHACFLFCNLIEMIKAQGVTVLLTSHILLKMGVSFDYIFSVSNCNISEVTYDKNTNHTYEVSLSVPDEEIRNKVCDIINKKSLLGNIVYENNVMSFKVQCSAVTWNILLSDIKNLSVRDVQFSVF